MRPIVMSALAAGLVALVSVTSAKAQTVITSRSGSSYRSNISTSFSSGPAGFQTETRRSGSISQWGNVTINSYSPVGQFSGSFSTGSSRSWDTVRGAYGSPYGSGSYGSVNRSDSNWNNGAWQMNGPGGSFGNSYSNVARDTRSRTWSRTYP